MEQLQDREFQKRIVQKAIDYFEKNDRSVMVESPTGSGKTIMGLAIAKYVEEKYGWRTNWMAMRRNLLKQVKETNDRFFGLKNLQPVSMFDRHPAPAEFLVSDEAHHDACDSAMTIHNKTNPRWTLGLSATPMRHDRMRLAFSRTIKDAGIHKLIQEGYLPPFHQYNIDQYTPQAVATTFMREPQTWGKSVVFFRTAEECVDLMLRLSSQGIACDFIHSGIPHLTREDILDRFTAGEIQVLVNMMILTEGFDEPTVESIFIRDSGKLPTMQMGGRGFRTNPGKTHVNIIQSQGTRWPFTRTALPLHLFTRRGSEWLPLDGSTKAIENEVHKTMEAIIASVDHAPAPVRTNVPAGWDRLHPIPGQIGFRAPGLFAGHGVIPTQRTEED